jgi:hypothetical protein
MDWLGWLTNHWWAGLSGPLVMLPRAYRRLARMADNEWHLSQCTAREAALTQEVMGLRAAAERAVQNQASGSGFSASTTSPTTPREMH